jgi:hypothetical protein
MVLSDFSPIIRATGAWFVASPQVKRQSYPPVARDLRGRAPLGDRPQPAAAEPNRFVPAKTAAPTGSPSKAVMGRGHAMALLCAFAVAGIGGLAALAYAAGPIAAAVVVVAVAALIGFGNRVLDNMTLP